MRVRVIATIAPATTSSRLVRVPSHLFALFTTTPVDQRTALMLGPPAPGSSSPISS